MPVVVSVPVVTDPLAMFALDHVPGQVPVPDVVQLVALVVVQESVVVPPLVTAVGLAVSVTVGAGVVDVGSLTTTVAVAELDPPGPVHVSV